MQEIKLEELALRSQNGDKESYRQLLKTVSPILMQFVSKAIFNADMREDVLQDILISLHRGLHSYLPDRSFKSWMLAIAKFRIIDHLRVYYRRKQREVQLGEFTDVAESVTPVEMDTNYLLEALENLPEKYREAIKVTKLQGVSIREAALTLGISEDALKARCSRGYKLLRKKLEKAVYEKS